jgi:hypothetical protein
MHINVSQFSEKSKFSLLEFMTSFCPSPQEPVNVVHHTKLLMYCHKAL